MLKLASRFVLEALPYLLLALAAVVLLPGVADSVMAAAFPAVFSSSPHAMETMTEPNGFGRDETMLDLIHQDYDAFATNQPLHETAKAAEDDLVNR